MAELNAKVTVDGSAIIPKLQSVLDQADRLRSVLVGCIEQLKNGLPLSWDDTNKVFVVDASGIMNSLNGIDQGIAPIQQQLHDAVTAVQAGLPITVNRVS